MATDTQPIRIGMPVDDPGARNDLRALALALATTGRHVTAGPADEHADIASDLRVLLGPAGTRRPSVARLAVPADRVSDSAAAALGRLFSIWVPSGTARQALVRSGIAPERVAVVAGAIDPVPFASAAAARSPEDRGPVRFLSVFDWTRRKGWDLLVRAYVEEFSARDEVSLVLKTFSSIGYSPDEMVGSVERLLEDLGRNADDVPDLVFDPHDVPAATLPTLYAAADCFVLPSRGEGWGRALLEARCAALPIIATDSIAGALRLDHSLVPVPDEAAREEPLLAGARWAEPDLDHLRRLMRDVFERSRRGQLARVTADDALTSHRLETVGRLAAAQLARAAATTSPPAPVRPARSGAHPRDVSFVLQGPISHDEPGTTARACAAIRAFFPGAEIVVSTWRGAALDGIDRDVTVVSDDPGPVGMFRSNVNRQIISSLAGVRAAGRPLVVKLRSDLLFHSDALLTHWGRWPARCASLRVFEERVLVPNVFARRPSYLSPFPHHPGDWSFFGTAGDLRRLFDIPLLRERDAVTATPSDPLTSLYMINSRTPVASPEQYVWTTALRKADPALRIEHLCDLTPTTLLETEVGIANNLAVLDTYMQYGITCPKYAGANRLFEDVSLYQHRHWLEAYEQHCCGPDTEPVEVDLPASPAQLRRCGDPQTLRALRRSGRHWEAQLLESFVVQPALRRDETFGITAERQALDVQAGALAGDHLLERLRGR